LTITRVDQPVGSGFSEGKSTATSESDIATDFNDWFLNFQNIFGIKNYKIYVTGESYAGRYIPYIANAMIEREDPAHFNLSGSSTYLPTLLGRFAYNRLQGSSPTAHQLVPTTTYSQKFPTGSGSKQAIKY
jgi:carboxypeptidase C (cathepsin A)